MEAVSRRHGWNARFPAGFEKPEAQSRTPALTAIDPVGTRTSPLSEQLTISVGDAEAAGPLSPNGVSRKRNLLKTSNNP
jgi:hypothetical protein